MFSINTKDIRRLEKDLEKFADKAFPFATRNTINGAAFAAQKIAKRNVTDDLTLRNRFTVQSIRVEQSRTLQVNRQEAIVGSIADYMEVQEFGGNKTKQGKKGVAITTGYAAGQQGKQPRTRVARKPNAMQNIQLRRGRRAKNKKQALLFKVQDAVSSGNKFFFHNFGRKQGIFKVLGGRKGFKRGWPKGTRLKMVHDLSRQSVRIPKRPWLLPAVDETEALIPGLYERSLRFQIRRIGLFR